MFVCFDNLGDRSMSDEQEHEGFLADTHTFPQLSRMREFLWETLLSCFGSGPCDTYHLFNEGEPGNPAHVTRAVNPRLRTTRGRLAKREYTSKGVVTITHSVHWTL
jgi:hypothetical protein